MNKQLETWKAIHQLFDETLPATPPKEEGEILQVIKKRVEELLHSDLGLLFSHLYRLDVDEHKVRHVLSENTSEIPVSYRLAKLIWERQKTRIQTKALFKRLQSGNVHDDDKW